MSDHRDNNTWFGVSLLLIGLILGYIIGTSLSGSVGGGMANAPTPSAPTPSAPTPAAPSGTAPKTGVGPVLGKSSATVTLVEFTDFQCPFCARHFTQTVPSIRKDYVDTGKIKYEHRNFPLTSIHPNAMIAAEASLCALKQSNDGFWKMHDSLFGKNAEWANVKEPDLTTKLVSFASDAGLNTSTFKSCLTNHDTAKQVTTDMADASAAGVTGTPGFWIISPKGSQFISGAVPYTTFQAAIDKLL